MTIFNQYDLGAEFQLNKLEINASMSQISDVMISSLFIHDDADVRLSELYHDIKFPLDIDSGNFWTEIRRGRFSFGEGPYDFSEIKSSYPDLFSYVVDYLKEHPDTILILIAFWILNKKLNNQLPTKVIYVINSQNVAIGNSEINQTNITEEDLRKIIDEAANNSVKGTPAIISMFPSIDKAWLYKETEEINIADAKETNLEILLNSKDEYDRVKAAQILGKFFLLSEVQDGLLYTLQNDNSDLVKATIIDIFSENNYEKCINVLKEISISSEKTIAKMALFALANIEQGQDYENLFENKLINQECISEIALTTSKSNLSSILEHYFGREVNRLKNILIKTYSWFKYLFIVPLSISIIGIITYIFIDIERWNPLAREIVGVNLTIFFIYGLIIIIIKSLSIIASTIKKE